MLPFLASTEISDLEGNPSVIANLAPWLQVLIVVGAIGGIALAGKFVISPVLRWVAKARLSVASRTHAYYLNLLHQPYCLRIVVYLVRFLPLRTQYLNCLSK